MKFDLVLKGFLLILLLALGAWVATATEWVEEEVPQPPRGEALTNELYATHQVLRQLGAKVVQPKELSAMPPPRATLMLSSWHWDLFPERERLLRDWVEGGGHLVLSADMLYNDRLEAWLPVKRLDNDEEDEEDDVDDHKAQAEHPPASAASSPRGPARKRKEPDCELVVEPDGVPPAYGERRPYRLCGGRGYPRIKVRTATVEWAVESDWAHQYGRGPEAVRFSLGRGHVTVLTNERLFRNDQVLQGDNTLLVVAALQARKGQDIWFVGEEARPPLLEWLWDRGWAAVLMGGLALALALWRGAVRFGPLSATGQPGRRSIAEQVRGTAQFLRHTGAGALHAAQLRALEEAAQNHLRDYTRLDRNARAQAIAKATGLPADDLARALDRKLKRSDRDLPTILALLETARRRLTPPSSR